ncbi:uncharacterized protein LOC142331385 [Lycorma delicatula]|uniref:uncharacterized protein LOC142331385 n=1 Tax=Lycorma delicatula TaxID=130591 RepID=UPI003F516020
MASCKFAVVLVFVGLVAVCYSAPADKQADVEAVPIEGPEAAKDLKASSSYGYGYGYPYGYGYGYGLGYGYGYPYYGYGLGYYNYYPRYYYGGYHGYPFFR